MMILQCLKSYTFINNGKMAQKVRKSDKKAQKKDSSQAVYKSIRFETTNM